MRNKVEALVLTIELSADDCMSFYCRNMGTKDDNVAKCNDCTMRFSCWTKE